MKPRSPLSAILLLLPLGVFADSATLISKTGDWESFTFAEKGGRVCYVASQPKSSKGAPKGRGATYFTITHRTSDKSIGVVSVAQGIAYKKDSAPQLEIGGTKFDLYVSGDTAWSRNDKAVVAALLKAKSVSVQGVPVKGDPVIDTYSLDGLIKAYGEIGKACSL
jgi:hypothetical protein